jgi:hypothetical protein
MKKIWLILALFIVVANGCKVSEPEPSPEYMKKVQLVVKEYNAAIVQANNNDPAGFLKLYKIARDDDIYTAEYSDVATETLHYLLYSKTDLWIKTFSKVDDLDSFKAYLKVSGMWVTELPKGVASDEQFAEEIFSKLKKIKGDEKEMELVDYILGLYNRKRPSPAADIFNKKPR